MRLRHILIGGSNFYYSLGVNTSCYRSSGSYNEIPAFHSLSIDGSGSLRCTSAYGITALRPVIYIPNIANLKKNPDENIWYLDNI